MRRFLCCSSIQSKIHIEDDPRLICVLTETERETIAGQNHWREVGKDIFSLVQWKSSFSVELKNNSGGRSLSFLLTSSSSTTLGDSLPNHQSLNLLVILPARLWHWSAGENSSGRHQSCSAVDRWGFARRRFRSNDEKSSHSIEEDSGEISIDEEFVLTDWKDQWRFSISSTPIDRSTKRDDGRHFLNWERKTKEDIHLHRQLEMEIVAKESFDPLENDDQFAHWINRKEIPPNGTTIQTFLSLVQTSRKDNRCSFWRHIMSTTIIEHREIDWSKEVKMQRKTFVGSSSICWTVRRCSTPCKAVWTKPLALPGIELSWRWSSISDRRDVDCLGACQRRSSHINRSLNRCNFFSTTSNQLRIEIEEETIDERQGEQSPCWPFIRHWTKTNPRTLIVERGGGRFTFSCSEFNARERERNRWWFRFWAKREEWSHLTACRRSKRDKQLKKRSVIGNFAHGWSIGGEGFARHVASEGWWRSNERPIEMLKDLLRSDVQRRHLSIFDLLRLMWWSARHVEFHPRERERVQTGSTGDTAVGGEMNRIVVVNDQGSTGVLSLARGMLDPWPFDRRSNEINLGKEERKWVFRCVKWSVLAAPMSILSKILPGAKSDWSIGLTKGISSTEGVEVAVGGWISSSNPKGTRRIQGANTDRNDDRLLRQGLNAQWSLRQIVTGPASTLIMGSQTDEGKGDQGEWLTDQRTTLKLEGRSIGSISVLAVQADRKQRDSDERSSDWDKRDDIEEIFHWTEAERDQRCASKHKNKSPLPSLLINALQNRSLGWCCRRSFKEKSSNIDLPRQIEENLFGSDRRGRGERLFSSIWRSLSLTQQISTEDIVCFLLSISTGSMGTLIFIDGYLNECTHCQRHWSMGMGESMFLRRRKTDQSLKRDFYSTISFEVILNGIQVETNMAKRKEKKISSIFSSHRMKNGDWIEHSKQQQSHLFSHPFILQLPSHRVDWQQIWTDQSEKALLWLPSTRPAQLTQKIPPLRLLPSNGSIPSRSDQISRQSNIPINQLEENRLTHSMGKLPLNWSIGTVFTRDHPTAFAQGWWSLLLTSTAREHGISSDTCLSLSLHSILWCLRQWETTRRLTRSKQISFKDVIEKNDSWSSSNTSGDDAKSVSEPIRTRSIDDDHPVTDLSLANLSLFRSICLFILWCLCSNAFFREESFAWPLSSFIGSVVSPFRVIRKKDIPRRSIPRQQRRIVRQRLISKNSPKSRLIFIGNRYLCNCCSELCRWVGCWSRRVALRMKSLFSFPREKFSSDARLTLKINEEMWIWIIVMSLLSMEDQQISGEIEMTLGLINRILVPLVTWIPLSPRFCSLCSCCEHFEVHR